jgi:TPR repeat protein
MSLFVGKMYSEETDSATDLPQFLALLGLSDYFPSFKDAGFDDLALLDDLDDDELKEMFSHVSLAAGHKLKLKKALQRRKQKGAGVSQSSHPPQAAAAAVLRAEEKAVVFGKYSSARVLGSGEFGVAHLVTDETGKQWVLKTQVCEDDNAVNEAQKEIIALAVMPSSPHLLKVRDAFLHTAAGGAPVRYFCIVLNYCSGGTVQDLVDKGKASPETVRKVLVDVARALVALHNAGMIHRDIKPDNLFFAEKCGDVVVGDMGLSRSVDSRSYYPGRDGYQSYQAPEVGRRYRFSPASDLWALGAVAVDLLTGKTMTERDDETKYGFILFHLGRDELTSFVGRALRESSAENHIVGRVVSGLLDKDYKARLTAEQVLSLLENKEPQQPLLSPLEAESKEDMKSQQPSLSPPEKAALYQNGLNYQRGLNGFEKDEVRAVDFFLKAAQQGEKMDWEGAEGDLNASLGYCYFNGQGVSQNYKRAVEWHQVRDQGHGDAQFNLAYCFKHGKGVPQDDKKAVEWYTKSADLGHAAAQCSLGLCYENGKGVPRDDKKAVEWYTKSAEQGHADARCRLDQYSQGVSNTITQAKNWLTKQFFFMVLP